jgi:thymidylate synthase
MYVPIPPQATCTQAWLKAAMVINNESGREAYNVIVDIDEPLTYTSTDMHIVELVDDFLRRHDSSGKRVYPLSTVANTIFPYGLFRRHGAPDFYDGYLQVYRRLKKPQDWGRYFHRMIYHETPCGGVINPLAALVEKLRYHVSACRTFRNIYEIAIFDPTKDAGRVMNRQCLSFLSFKLHPEKGLMLTAMYRNHYYIARGLGNFIGLSWLQEFIANEAGVPVGPITCISTHAEIDRQPWGTREVDELLQVCAADASQDNDGLDARLVAATTP